MPRMPYDETSQRVRAMVQNGVPRQEVESWLGAQGWPLQEFRAVGRAAVPGWAQAVGQGATLGFSDEITAGAGALYDRVTGASSDMGKAYDQRLEAERAELGRFKEEHPIASTALELGGAVAPALLTGGMAAAPSLGSAMVRGAAMGAGAGAAYGFGTGEGAADRAENALAGIPLGAVAGAAAPVAVNAGRAIYGALRGASPERAAETGVSKIRQALERDEMTPDDLANRYREAAKVRGPGQVTLADVGGENVKGLAEDVMNSPNAARSAARDMLTTRQQKQLDRITGDLRGLGGAPREAADVASEVMKRRSGDARQLYDTAYQFDVAQSPEVAKTVRALMDTPDGQRAWKYAERLAKNRGEEIDFSSVIEGKQVPSMKMLDYWKNGLDQVIDEHTATDMIGRRKTDRVGASVQNIKQRFLEIVDQANPDYKAARNAFAGESSYLNALEDGASLFSERADELALKFSRMTESEQAAYRVGAINAIVDKMAHKRGKAPDFTAVLDSPDIRRKLAILLPEGERDAFMARLGIEEQMSETARRATGNSATARRMAEAENVSDSDVVEDGMRAVVNGVPGLREILFNRYVKPMVDKALAGRRGEIGRRVLSTDERRNMETIMRLIGQPVRPTLTAAPAEGMPAAVGATKLLTDPDRPDQRAPY